MSIATSSRPTGTRIRRLSGNQKYRMMPDADWRRRSRMAFSASVSTSFSTRSRGRTSTRSFFAFTSNPTSWLSPSAPGSR